MSTAAPTSRPLTRLTLVGPLRRADLVLPSDTPLGELLPDIVRFLGFTPGQTPQAYQVSLFDGQVVPLNQSLRTAGVPDGAIVRVDHLSNAPMAAVVHDVTDEVADDLQRRSGRWGDTPRRWVATGVAAAAALGAAVLAAPAVAAPVLLAIGVLLLLSGTGIALTASRAIGTALLFAGAAVAAASVPGLPGGGAVTWVAWLVLLGLTVFAAAVANGHLRAGTTGAAVLLGLLALWVVFALAGLSPVRDASLLAIISTALLGLLPRLALVTSGLTRLDDRQSAAQPSSRAPVLAAVDAAHRGLALAVVGTAASAAAAGWILAHAPSWWAMVLAGLLATTTLLRVRACPLTVEVVALIAAALVIVAGLVRHWVQAVPGQWWGAALVGVVLMGLALLSMAYQPPAHVRARGRQLADRVEGLVVIAMVPVAVGVFGIFSSLLATF